MSILGMVMFSFMSGHVSSLVASLPSTIERPLYVMFRTKLRMLGCCFSVARSINWLLGLHISTPSIVQYSPVFPLVFEIFFGSVSLSRSSLYVSQLVCHTENLPTLVSCIA